MSGKYAHVCQLEDEAVALACLAHRQWWRLLKNHHRHRECARLLAQAKAELDAIAERSLKFREAQNRRRAAS